MQTDIIVLIIVMSIILIGVLLKDTVMHTISLKRAETNCDIVVKSKTTEKEYHVSKYRISESKGMELRIYNPYIGGYD